MAKKYRRKTGIISHEVDGELHILDEEHDEIISLTKSATVILNYLAKPRTLNEIVEKMVEEYRIDERTARIDVKRLLGKLRKKGLLD